MKGETYKIDLLSGFTGFGTTIIKPYIVDDENTENCSLTLAKIFSITQNSLSDTIILPAAKDILIATTRPSRTQQPLIRYQNMANISSFLSEKDSPISLAPHLFIDSK